MGLTNFVPWKEKWHTPLLRLFSEIERGDDRGFYQFLQVDKCINSLGDAVIFSKFHASSRYWKLETAEEDREKTATWCYHCPSNFIRMFSDWNPSTGFQRAENELPKKVRWEVALEFWDHIEIIWRTRDEHIDHCRQALTLRYNTFVTLSIKMCILSNQI